MKYLSDPVVDRLLSEEKILGKKFDFTSKYFAVYELRSLVEKSPAVIVPETIRILENLLKDKDFARQRQGFFLFRETADTLGALIQTCRNPVIAQDTFSALKRVLAQVSGHAHRATAEALGKLPTQIDTPRIRKEEIDRIPAVNWNQIPALKGLKTTQKPKLMGRSLVARCDCKNLLLVVKMARRSDTAESLAREIDWLEHFHTSGCRFNFRFDIPEPIRVNDCRVFKLKKVPIPRQAFPDRSGYAIAFVTGKDYFLYPNSPGLAEDRSGQCFTEMITRNARILGMLSARGVIHPSLIPLFHNRVQVGRRRDEGLYEWYRGGRLDRWLQSCAYPNMGATGIRDFEHLTCHDGNRMNLYRHMGSHFLSLFLVAGSYFRNKNRHKVGLEPNGEPVDARELFDRELLEKTVLEIFHSYYRGFVGSAYLGRLPFDPGNLADRMIEEMGVDRHMEEILRVADQKEMSEAEFKLFLKNRGFSPERIENLKKGREEIVILSGPHLGGFNDRISLPELIEAVASMAAVCVAGKFWSDTHAMSLS